MELKKNCQLSATIHLWYNCTWIHRFDLKVTSFIIYITNSTILKVTAKNVVCYIKINEPEVLS